MKKMYWAVNKETKEINLEPIFPEFRGGVYHIPKDALIIKPLEEKKGFAVLAKLDLNEIAIGSEYIEDNRGKTIYLKSNCNKKSTVRELGLIQDKWTEQIPMSKFDEFINDKWIKNKREEYISKFNEIDNKRRDLYSEIVDPFLQEAQIKRIIKTKSSLEEALNIERQAIFLRKKIQDENPWPEPVL